MGARRTWLSIALLAIWWLIVDLAAQIIETLAIWTLTHYQPCLYSTSTWLGALKTIRKGCCVLQMVTVRGFCKFEGKKTGEWNDFHCIYKTSTKHNFHFSQINKGNANEHSRVCSSLWITPVLPVLVLPLPSCRRSTVDMALTRRTVAHWADCDPHSCWQGTRSHPGTLRPAAGNLLHMCWSTVVTNEECPLSNFT